MFRQICKKMKLPKVRMAALLSQIIVMIATTCCVSANETGFRDVLDETGTYSCLSAKEAELLDLINRYRASHGLPAIANSRSLNKVARVHVLDLAKNLPAEGKDHRGEDCNLHSWSDQGSWTPVCYTSDPRSAERMWDKAKEITNYGYTEAAYENAYWTSQRDVSPARALEGWKKSPKHNALILETGVWEGLGINAIGVGIYKGFAVIWVGNAHDALGPMEACTIPTQPIAKGPGNSGVQRLSSIQFDSSRNSSRNPGSSLTLRNPAKSATSRGGAQVARN
jgi:uncharacterized protein YkwD